MRTLAMTTVVTAALALTAWRVAKARESAKNEYLAALRREESLKSAMKVQRTETMKFNSDVVGYNTLKLEVDTKHRREERADGGERHRPVRDPGRAGRGP